MKTALLVLLCTAITLAGQARGNVFPERNRQFNETKERLITLRNWKLMEEFNLSGERAQKVFKILSKFDRQRERQLVKRRRLIKRLMDAINKQARDDELERLMNELGSTNAELSRIPQRELEGLKDVFSTRELARYLLFSQRFAREARSLLHGDMAHGPRRNAMMRRPRD